MRSVIYRIGAGLGLGLVVGLLVGFLLPVVWLQVANTPWFLTPPQPSGTATSGHDDHDHDHDHDHHAEEDHDHVDVTRQARLSLGLQRGMAVPGDFTAWTYVPAAVMERPGVSDLHLVTRFEGIVEEIMAVPGQAVREGDPLFRIRLTGDALAAAQAALLEAVQQTAILDQEIDRLQAVVQQGGLAGRTLLELEYERKRMLARKGTKRQELAIRGLSPEQIAQITETEQLVRTVTVCLPEGLVQQVEPQGEHASDAWPFTIEELSVTPGSYVRPGDPLCNLAYHARLNLVGYAFERDIHVIAHAIGQGHAVVAELGDANDPIQMEDLRIIHLDNHVDPTSQTYRFYIELKNEILQDNLRADGRRFRTWRWKPGQRGHVGLPSREFHGVFVLPSEAVVSDGLQQIVFRRMPTPNQPSAERATQTSREPFNIDDDVAEEEYVPVPLRVLHRDRHVVVASADDELQTGDVIALNAAYQLLLAMRASPEGHDHHHDH